MKYLLIPGALLVALASVCLLNAKMVADSIELPCEAIDSARQAAQTGNWTQARARLGQANAAWDRRKRWLHLVVGHSALDEADALFEVARSYAEGGNAPEFLAESARLAAQLRHLALTQELSVRNIL